MAQARVSVPATINNFGPGIDSIALAVRLYHSIELSEADTGFVVDVQPEVDQDEITDIGRALLSTIRALAQQSKCTPSGLQAVIQQGSLAGHGLGLDDGLALGCAIALNALTGGVLGRDEITQVVLGIGTRPAPTIASLHGNLAVALGEGKDALHTVITPASMEVILLLPDEPEGESAGRDVGQNGAATALLVDGLRTGNLALLHDLSAMLLRDRSLPAGWDEMTKAAQEAGASGVFIINEARSAAVFARGKHEQIGQLMVEAYVNATGSTAHFRVVPVETHGISIDAIGISADTEHIPIPASPNPA